MPSMSAKCLKADIRELAGKVAEVPEAVIAESASSATSLRMKLRPEGRV
jgi:hypothetical protein